MRFPVFVICLLAAVPAAAQQSFFTSDPWHFDAKLELRANYRNSEDSRFQLQFPFSPGMLPPGETAGFARTVDPGSHWEASLISLTLDLGYRSTFAARAKIDAIDLYDRNPTSTDRKVDADELWIRFGPKPDGLDLPEKTSLFVQVGKAPKMERQPRLLLESYGLVATAFNRMEDTQLLVGGSVGRHLYWRAQLSNGNPLFFRDTNALAGDNGIPPLLEPHPNPPLHSGFPILYDAEVESLSFDTDHMETGGGLGYRWLKADLTGGFDLIAFYYERELAQTVDLHGTFYGGDLDLLDGVPPHSIPTAGDRKREGGARFYGEWGGGTLIAQYVTQTLAGLDRDGYEIEAGWEIPLSRGPVVGGRPLLSWIQPAVRFSELDNHFKGVPSYPAPSTWWDWRKTDVGIRIGLLDHLEITAEHAFHDILIAKKVDADETLISLRYIARTH